MERRERLALLPPTTKAADFPVHALGPTLGLAAQAISDIVQCPPALAAQSVLATASFVVQGHADIMHPMGKRLPISLMFVTVAESGERKSTADELALRAVREAEQEERKQYDEAFRRWRNNQQANEAERARAKRNGDREVLDKIIDKPAPLHWRRAISEPNYEGLLRHMERGHGSLAWFNNEAAQSVGGTALHDDNKLKFGAGLSRLWDGQDIDRLRSGDGAQVFVGRRLTLHLMLQPAIASALLNDPRLRDQGIWSRTLVCEPESRMGSRLFRNPREDDQAKLVPYYRRVRSLYDAPYVCAGADNELSPQALELTDGAKTTWIACHDRVELSLATDGELATVRGFGAKLAENVLRMAGVMAFFEGSTTVEQVHLERAVCLGDYFAEEACRVVSRAAVDADIALAEAVRAWMTNPQRWPRETIRLRDIMQRGPSQARARPSAMKAVELLQRYGWLTSLDDKGQFQIEGRGG